MSGLAVLFAVEVTVVVAGVAGMFWLRRVADRRWRRYQAMRPMIEALDRMKVQLAEQLMPAMREMARAIEEAGPKFQRLGEALREKGLR